MSDDDIDLSEIPEITAEQMKRAVLRVNGLTVPTGKVLIPLLLDTEIVTYFQDQAGERSYADLINDVLKTVIPHNAKIA